jgi:YD repeat-containing protein
MTLGKEMTYGCDGLSRLTCTTSGGSRPTTYAYDTVSQQVTYGKPRSRLPFPTSPTQPGERVSRRIQGKAPVKPAWADRLPAFLYDGDNVVADLKPDGGGLSVDRFYVTPFLDQNLSMEIESGGVYRSTDFAVGKPYSFRSLIAILLGIPGTVFRTVFRVFRGQYT